MTTINAIITNMAKEVSMRMLMQHSKEIFQLVAEGHDVIVTKHGKPIARITPEKEEKKLFKKPNILARLDEDFPNKDLGRDPIDILLEERYGDEYDQNLL